MDELLTNELNPEKGVARLLPDLISKLEILRSILLHDKIELSRDVDGDIRCDERVYGDLMAKVLPRQQIVLEFWAWAAGQAKPNIFGSNVCQRMEVLQQLSVPALRVRPLSFAILIQGVDENADGTSAVLL